MKKSYKNFTLFALLIAAQILTAQKALSKTDLLIELNQPEEEEPLPEQDEAYSVNRQSVADILTHFTLGNDALYNKVLSPAKSLNEQRSDADRTAEANIKIQKNLAAIMDAFDNASEDQKAAKVEETLKKLDSNFEKGQSGRIEFTDGKISAAFSRIGFVIEKQNATAQMVLDAFTSYKRAAKPSDHVFLYEDYQDITRGTVAAREGTDTTWFPPLSPASMAIGSTVVVKKCRQILGWKCGTTLYHADQKENFKYVFMGNYDLSKNPDNPYFKGDSRTRNQIAGSTALFVMKESEKHILFAAADSTWNKKGLSFTSIIQGEYQKDLNKFKQRLMFDLGRNRK